MNQKPIENSQQQQQSKRVTSGNAELDAKIREWLAWDKNKTTVDQVKKLVRAEAFEQLRKMFMTRLKYSIDGFKGPMEAGYNAINDIFIIQCGQGLLRYLELNEWRKLKSVGVVIGFDARNNSKRFADLLATIFVQKNYSVKLYNVVVPSALVIHAIVKYKAAAGVMICIGSGSNTENGLQIYDSSAIQIVHPAESELEECIAGNLEPLNTSWEMSILNNNDLKVNPLTEVLKSYLDMIQADVLHEYKEINKKSSNKFVYTPLHGVGFIYMARAFDMVGLQMIPVEEEKYPSHKFDTKSVPDFKGDIKLDIAVAVAQKEKSNYIIATNPHCSRVVVAEKDPESGDFKFFNSDELALLLAWWTYHVYQDKIDQQPQGSNLYIVGNIFNTNLIKQMARIDGFYFMETLGGKWLGYTVKKLLDEKKSVIFGYDGYGYIVNPSTLSKDGIQAGIQLCCFINYLSHHKLTLRGHLEELYKEYGFYTNLKFCFKTENEEETELIYQRLRFHKGAPEYPRSMCKGKYSINFIRDLKNKLDTAQENKRSILPEDPNVELISFKFDNYAEVTLYSYKLMPLSVTLHTSISGPGSTPEERIELKTILLKTTYAFIEEFLEPIKNNLCTEWTEMQGIRKFSNK